MASLALTAGLIDDDNDNDMGKNYIQKKKQNNASANNNNNNNNNNNANSKIDRKKVDTVISNLHNKFVDDDTDMNSLNTAFKPINPLIRPSINSGNKLTTETFKGMDFEYNPSSVSSLENAMSLSGEGQTFNTLDNNNYMANHNQKYNGNHYKVHSQRQAMDMQRQPMDMQSDIVLIDKLNYIIHLLEEQQDVKTNHVMEEVILYAFLGIFIIFILDCCLRPKKYIR